MSALTFAIVVGIGVFIVLIALVFLINRIVVSRITHKSSVVKRSAEMPLIGDSGGKSQMVKHRKGATTHRTDASRGRSFIFASAIAGLFGVLLAKLWSLQILNGSYYKNLAEKNFTVATSTVAARGRILDRNGKELVKNRASLTLVGSADLADDRNLVHRLSLLTGIPKTAIRARLLDESAGAQADRVIASDISMRAIAFLSEHPTFFSGVTVEPRTVRTYPYGTTAAHVLGYTGTISESQLAAESNGISYESTDIVGKSGIEAAYESLLQGTHGTKTYKVDSSGAREALLDEIPATPGSDIVLTIDIEVQKAAEQALAQAFLSCARSGYTKASAGAVVAIDVTTGEVLVMASAPTFDPSQFIGGISTDLWSELTEKGSGYPLNNRAIAGLYPAASTFKAFTGLAGLHYDIIDSDTVEYCSGIWTGFGTKYAQKCWLETGHGAVNLREAIKVSCDVFFYNVAKGFYDRRGEGETILQDYLKTWGFGNQTGIDIAGEAAGRVPTPAWKLSYYWDAPETGQWYPGDMSNLIIGQGDVLVTPLQEAVAFGGIATGTNFVPRLLKEVHNSQGGIPISFQTKLSATQPKYTGENLAIMRGDLRNANYYSDAFQNTTLKAAGKSGTGETGDSTKDDYGWYTGYAPYDNPKYCVTCCIEQAGGGTAFCGPVVRYVLCKLLGINEEKIDMLSLRDDH